MQVERNEARKMPVIPKPADEPPLFGDDAKIVFGAHRSQKPLREDQTDSAPTVPIRLVERWDFDKPTFETPRDPLD